MCRTAMIPDVGSSTADCTHPSGHGVGTADTTRNDVMQATLAAAIIGAAVALAVPLAGQATAPSFAPIDVRVAVPPRPLVGGGGTHLVYELHVTNYSSRR